MYQLKMNQERKRFSVSSRRKVKLEAKTSTIQTVLKQAEI